MSDLSKPNFVYKCTIVDSHTEVDGSTSYHFIVSAELGPLAISVTNCRLEYEQDEVGLGTTLLWQRICHTHEANLPISEVFLDIYQDELLSAVMDALRK